MLEYMKLGSIELSRKGESGTFISFLNNLMDPVSYIVPALLANLTMFILALAMQNFASFTLELLHHA